MRSGETIGGDPWVTVGRFRYKPIPADLANGQWFRWSTKMGGLFEIISEDEVPDECWAWLAKRALMGEP